MRLVPLAHFMPLVMPYAPTAPEPIVMLHLRLAAREFCKDTRCWREIITTEITANPIEPDLSCAATIVAVQSAMLNGRDLTPVPFIEAEIDTYLTKVGRASEFTQDQMDRFIIMPFEPGTLVMSLYLAPSAGPKRMARDPQAEAQNQVPAFLFDEHVEAIAHGALSRIMSIPAQEYTNGNMAGFFAAKFDQAKGEATTAAIKGKQRAPIRTKPRWM